MSAIVLQSKRVGYTATVIGPFESIRAADEHALELCRQGHDEYVYSVLTMVPPAELNAVRAEQK